jgi:hypothetical protein
MPKKYLAYAGSYFDIEWYYSPSGKTPAVEHYKTLDLAQKKKFWFLIETLGNDYLFRTAKGTYYEQET